MACTQRKFRRLLISIFKQSTELIPFLHYNEIHAIFATKYYFCTKTKYLDIILTLWCSKLTNCTDATSVIVKKSLTNCWKTLRKYNNFVPALKASFIFSQCINHLNCITCSRLRIWICIYNALVAMATSDGFLINFVVTT